VDREDGSRWDDPCDPLGQLTSAKHKDARAALLPEGDFDYACDDLGNCKTERIDTQNTDYRANALKQIEQAAQAGAVQPLTYDLDGSVVADATWTYAWDAENRLVGLDALDPKTKASRLEFHYDSHSRRIAKSVTKGHDNFEPRTTDHEPRTPQPSSADS
jgi:hypothetical protein